MKKVLIMLLGLSIFTISCSKKEENKETQNQQQSQTSQVSSYQKTDFYFKLPSKDGEIIDLANYKGKSVMVIFFTENCPFCQKAAPFIDKIYSKYHSKGLEVVGISVKKSRESSIEFQQITGVKFPLAYDGREVAKTYGISGVPFIYLLDKNHNLKRVWAGYDEEYNKDIIDAIEKTL